MMRRVKFLGCSVALALSVFVSISFAEESEDLSTRLVDIDPKVGLKMPRGFKLVDMPYSERSHVAVRPNQDEADQKVYNNVPLIAVSLASPMTKPDKADYLAKALKGMQTHARNGGRTIKGEPVAYRKNGVVGYNLVSENETGKMFWGVRTIHLKTHSAILYFATHDKSLFDQLADYGKNVALVSK